MFVGCALQQRVGISMSTNCACILADLFLCLSEADFIQDDVLSISNSKFCDFVDHLYPVEIEIKDTI
jgi:hypothetical protein